METSWFYYRIEYIMNFVVYPLIFLSLVSFSNFMYSIYNTIYNTLNLQYYDSNELGDLVFKLIGTILSIIIPIIISMLNKTRKELERTKKEVTTKDETKELSDKVNSLIDLTTFLQDRVNNLIEENTILKEDNRVKTQEIKKLTQELKDERELNVTLFKRVEESENKIKQLEDSMATSMVTTNQANLEKITSGLTETIQLLNKKLGDSGL